jgi:hypothetical protein
VHVPGPGSRRVPDPPGGRETGFAGGMMRYNLFLLETCRSRSSQALQDGSRAKRGAVKRHCLLGSLVMLAGLVSCSGGSQPSSTTSSSGIVVTVSPATVSVNAGSATPTQFTVTLTGATNLIVTWMVNDVAGGNSTLGTIDSNGLYVAPAQVPSPGTVTVKAVSSEDSTAVGTAAVTILSPPQVTVTPKSPPPVLPGGQVKFTATVTGAATTNVNWTVNNIPVGNKDLGFILSDGTYNAPLSPPPGGTVTVTAASRDFPQSTDSATVTLTSFATVSLDGAYAFSLTGKNATGTFYRAGSFTADGAGRLTGGLEDINDASGSIANPVSFDGSYVLGPDGRGTMQFNDGQTPNSFHIVLVGNSQLQIIGFDGSGTASGQANLQDLSQFRTTGVFSTYVFDFTGIDSGSAVLSLVGEFTADGQGNITNGQVDINDGRATSRASFGGAYTVGSNGRGTATLALPGGDIHFTFYIVDRGSAKFVQTDPRATAGTVAGVTTQQAPNLNFTSSSLNGNYAFLLAGASPSGAIATAGQFFAAGNGQITSGVLDENLNGTVTANVAISSGTYAVDPTGRGIATLTTTGRTYQVVFYLGPAGNFGIVRTGIVQETDSSIVSDGLFVQQQGGAFTAASVQISYALAISGLQGSSPLVLDGQLKSDGVGAISSGTIDVNTAGSLTSDETAAGSYTINSTGRGTLTLNPSGDNRNFSIYFLSPLQAFVLGTDSGRLAAGALLRQF